MPKEPITIAERKAEIYRLQDNLCHLYNNVMLPLQKQLRELKPKDFAEELSFGDYYRSRTRLANSDGTIYYRHSLTKPDNEEP